MSSFYRFPNSRFRNLLAAFFVVSSSAVYAQTDTTQVEEDYSKYETAQVLGDGSVKRYATQKVFGQTPARLISIGYEYQLPFALRVNTPQPATATDNSISDRVTAASGLRVEANFPIISRNNIIWNLGGGYADMNYSTQSAASPQVARSTFANALSSNGLRNFYATTTLFKPFDEKNLLIVQALAEYAGDWRPNSMMPLSATKISATAVYGRKIHDRFMWGVGATRTFRAGQINYLPVVLLNYTSRTQKWGIEMLAPARADFRYNFTSRNMLRLGVELEGTSYRLHNGADNFKADGNTVSKFLELRRSEIKFRAIWDAPIKDFYWFSLQAGYRTFYNFSLDDGDPSPARSLFSSSNALYFQRNLPGGGPFVSLIFNLVSP